MRGGGTWLLDVDYDAVFASPQCIVRDEYTECKNRASLTERVVESG